MGNELRIAIYFRSEHEAPSAHLLVTEGELSKREFNFQKLNEDLLLPLGLRVLNSEAVASRMKSKNWNGSVRAEVQARNVVRPGNTGQTDPGPTLAKLADCQAKHQQALADKARLTLEKQEVLQQSEVYKLQNQAQQKQIAKLDEDLKRAVRKLLDGQQAITQRGAELEKERKKVEQLRKADREMRKQLAELTGKPGIRPPADTV